MVTGYRKDMSSSTKLFHLDFKSWYTHRSWSFSMIAVFHDSLFPFSVPLSSRRDTMILKVTPSNGNQLNISVSDK